MNVESPDKLVFDSGAQLWTGSRSFDELQRIGGAGTLVRWSVAVFCSVANLVMLALWVFSTSGPTIDVALLFPLFVMCISCAMIRLNVCGVEIDSSKVKMVGFWRTRHYSLDEVKEFKRGSLIEWICMRDGTQKIIVGLLYWNDGFSEISITTEAVKELNRRLASAKESTISNQ